MLVFAVQTVGEPLAQWIPIEPRSGQSPEHAGWDNSKGDHFCPGACPSACARTLMHAHYIRGVRLYPHTCAHMLIGTDPTPPCHVHITHTPLHAHPHVLTVNVHLQTLPAPPLPHSHKPTHHTFSNTHVHLRLSNLQGLQAS